VHKKRFHSDLTPFKCSFQVCRKEFIMKGDLNRHLEQSHGQENKSVQRENAASLRSTQTGPIPKATKFKSKKQQQQQKQQLKGQGHNEIPMEEFDLTEWEFECVTCHQTYPTAQRLRKHVRKQRHFAIEPHECPICLATFPTMKEFSQHFSSHDP
jgi:hypothetical protein